MKVLIGNFHNSVFGGGEFYTYQTAKAISAFAEVLFINEPNKQLWLNNPDLKLSNYRVWDSVEQVDTYVNINHFRTFVCNTAKQNVLVVFFPNKEHKVAEYKHVVSLCPFVAKNVKEVWGRDSGICAPYSKTYKPGKKTPNTILAVGNFFMEADGHSKNQHELINAFKGLKGGPWKLTLMGSEVNSEYVAKLREMANGLNVEIIPNADEKLKDAYLSSSEFFWHANGYGRVDPYQSEHFGIAPEEAIKSGCLTYVHNSGGAKDFATSWDTIPDLIKLTETRASNKEGIVFQTPLGMEKYWRRLLNAA